MTDSFIVETSRLQKSQDFDLQPDANERDRLAQSLGIRGIKKLRLTGSVGPEGAKDLLLTAKLGTTVVQDCVVTGDPVTTRIDEDVVRHYLAKFDVPEGSEVEMPEDDNIEPIPAEIDLNTLMSEAIALALPPWPRADGVDPVNITVTEPGIAPMTDEAAKPFAGLQELKDKMRKTDDS